MTARWVTADVFDGLATLDDGSIDLVVTSPPFLALRSYLPADHPDKSKEIGSEATPAEFIDTLLAVTGELRRVLAPHGSICVELGDTYSGSGGGGGDYLENGWREGQQQFAGSAASMRESNAAHWRQKNQNADAWPLAKSQALIPQLYEIALAYGVNPLTGQPSPADQWRIRNVVTWARPNPPVGALGDKWRPATSDLIVACTSSKRYWDDLATRRPHQVEPTGEPDFTQAKRASDTRPPGGDQRGYMMHHGNTSGAPLLDYWEIPPGGFSGAHYAVFPPELVVPCVKAMCPAAVCLDCGTVLGSKGAVTRTILRGVPGGDNESLANGHDPFLLEDVRQSEHRTQQEVNQRLDSNDEGLHRGQGTDSSSGRQVGIRARTSSGDDGEIRPDAVPRRGSPSFEWDQGRQPPGESGGNGETSSRHSTEGVASDGVSSLWRVRSSEEPCPACGGTLRRGRTLDPFAGSGTTLAVATGHGHDAIGIDLDPRNADLARDRIGPFLFEVLA